MNPIPTGLPREAIEQIAASFARQVGFQAGRALDGVVKRLKGEIRVQHNRNDGELIVAPDRSFKIFLSPSTGRMRDRFTVAHELGHFVLHARLGEKPIQIARSGSNKLEAEANLFAAALLMPEKEFRAAAGELKADHAIAGRFDVSLQAVRVRRQVLGIPSQT